MVDGKQPVCFQNLIGRLFPTKSVHSSGSVTVGKSQEGVVHQRKDVLGIRTTTLNSFVADFSSAWELFVISVFIVVRIPAACLMFPAFNFPLWKMVCRNFFQLQLTVFMTFKRVFWLCELDSCGKLLSGTWKGCLLSQSSRCKAIKDNSYLFLSVFCEIRESTILSLTCFEFGENTCGSGTRSFPLSVNQTQNVCCVQQKFYFCPPKESSFLSSERIFSCCFLWREEMKKNAQLQI